MYAVLICDVRKSGEIENWEKVVEKIKGVLYQETGRVFGITKQGVSGILKRAKWDAIENGMEVIESVLKFGRGIVILLGYLISVFGGHAIVKFILRNFIFTKDSGFESAGTLSSMLFAILRGITIWIIYR